MYKHILVATDGSIAAHKGVEQGFALAKSLSAKVTVVTVTRPFPMAGVLDATGWVAGDADQLRYEAGQKDFAETVFRDARKSAETAGVTPDYVRVSNSSPAEGLLEAAKANGCDLIVMASHGRRGIGRLLLGSETAEVLHHSTLPVLVIR